MSQEESEQNEVDGMNDVLKHAGASLWVGSETYWCVYSMLENDPESFLESPDINSVIVQYASVACTMLHKDAQASALSLLSVLTNVADPEVQ